MVEKSFVVIPPPLPASVAAAAWNVLWRERQLRVHPARAPA
jgi:hypothetical protein